VQRFAPFDKRGKEKGMRRNMPVSLVVFASLTLLAAGVAAAGEMHGGKVEVKLSPAPNVKSSAGGTATFELGKDGNTIHYKLDVGKIENVTMAHVHQVGDQGVPGPVLVWLFPTTGMTPTLREGKVEGTLAEGDITADKLVGPSKGKPMKELLGMLGHGKAGVAVHTKQNPGGELWSFRKEMKEHKEMKEPKGMKGY
jgi:hypothetical protein